MTTPASLPSAFGAYITCFLPAALAARTSRLRNFERQLDWWLSSTDVIPYPLLSGWSSVEVDACHLLDGVAARGGRIRCMPACPLIENRILCLESFYASDHDWGIMLDDDAVLYDGPEHNCGPMLFEEMAANGLRAYEGVDVFFPLNPQKKGFRALWETDPDLYSNHHVFHRNLDLKGSMFVVRNFVKEGRPKVLPDSSFRLHGEDTLFAIEAVRRGCTVMECQNVILKEFTGPSHFAKDNKARTSAMTVGNREIAKRYAQWGLAMKPSSHLLDRSQFLRRCWGDKAQQVVVARW